MVNPIKDNRIVDDLTFAVRLLAFVKSVTPGCAADEDEKESMISYAERLLKYQCKTVTDPLEIDYLKRVGVWDEYNKPLLITQDGFKIEQNEKGALLYSCMKVPSKGDQILHTRIYNETSIQNRNKDRLFFKEEENCKQYLRDHSPLITRARLKELGLLEEFEKLNQEL